jgi:hypothetical protein
VAEFLEAHAGAIVMYSCVRVYLGSERDVTCPVVREVERIEGGEQVPFVQGGKVLPGVTQIVGGTKVQVPRINAREANLLDYAQGEYRDPLHLATSHVYFDTGYFDEQGRSVRKPYEFLRWARKVVNWLRRRATESVRVDGCNYDVRATPRAEAACRKGLKVR